MPTIEGTTLLHVFLVIRLSVEQKQFVRSLFSHITNTRNENVLRCRQGWIQNVGNVDVPGGSSTAMGSRTYRKRCNVHGALSSTWLEKIKS